MLNDTDALEVLNHLRRKVIDAGFGDFDSHVFSSVVDELGREQRQPSTASALLEYVRLTGDLMVRVGAARQAQAREILSEFLECSDGISIVLGTVGAHSIFDPNGTHHMPLEGSTLADDLAVGLNQLYSEIERFQYPDPTPRGGMNP
jgi:hypothetical protein